MLKQRIITGLSLLAIIFCLLFLAPVIFLKLTILLVIATAAWEWANFAHIENPIKRLLFASSVALLNLLLFYLATNGSKLFDPDHLLIILGIALVWWLVALVLVSTYPKTVSLWRHPVIKAGLAYIVLVPASLALLYVLSLANGQWLFLYLVGIVVVADVGAYIFGRWLGKAKLLPLVSPGKSWAGFWGGLLCVMLASLLISYLYPVFNLSSLELLVCTAIATLASVLGDLLESVFKRERGIKDSSQLLPGHGGFMDRIDSVTAAAPVFVFLVLMLQVN